MQLYTLYSKLLFAVIGLLFAFSSFGQDTINQFDKNGKKHGWWVKTQKSNHPLIELDTIEKGWYSHGKKEGIHLFFHPENIRSSAIEYSNDFRNGKYILYDSKGCILYHGNIIKEVLTGVEYSRDSCNGDFTIKNYDSFGRVSGNLFVYEEWGVLKSFSYWDNGKRIYTANFDTTGKVTYKSNDLNDTLNPPDSVINVDPKKIFNDQYMNTQMRPLMKNCYGPHIYKSAFKSSLGRQISEDGEFRDGKLWNGKKYIYDKNGLLDKIEIWKNGKYAGDAQID